MAKINEILNVPPAGIANQLMCTYFNVLYGNREVAQAAFDQVCAMPRFTPVGFANQPTIDLARAIASSTLAVSETSVSLAAKPSFNTFTFISIPPLNFFEAGMGHPSPEACLIFL